MGRRRVRLVLVISLAAAIGAAASVVVYRVPIFETLIMTALRANAVPAPRMTVSDVGWDGIDISDVSLGQAGEVTVRGVRLDYSLSGLLAGRLERVAVDGLAITLDLTGNAPLLGSLQPLLSGGGSGSGESRPLPPLLLTDLRVDAQTPVGIVRTVGNGQIRTANDGETAIEMSLQEITLGGNAVASGRLSVSLAPARTEAILALRARESALTFNARATIGNPLGSQATGTVDLSVTDLSMPNRIAGLDARVRLAIDAAEGILTVRFPEDATLAATQVSPAFLQGLGVPNEIAGQLTQGFAARLQAPEADGPVAIASRDDGTVAVVLDGTLHLKLPGLVDLSLTLPADIRAGPDRIRGQLRSPAVLRLTKLRYGGLIELLEPIVISLAEAEVTVAPDPAGGNDLDYRLALDAPAIRLQSQDVKATFTSGRITLTPGRTEIAEAQIAIPAYGLVAKDVSATLDVADNETRVGFQIASFRQTGPAAMFAPFSVTGLAIRKGGVWTGNAKGEGPDGIGRIMASGRHDGATARGQARITLEPLVFETGGAQPGVLIPALEFLQSTTGTASGEANLSWTAKGVQGTGMVALADIGFESPQAKVEGIDLRLDLDSLIPPGSPPGQTLSVRRLDPGVPLDRLDIRFQIRPTAPPSIVIETAEAFLGSGRFALSDLTVDPAVPRQDLDLRIQDLSLTELFAILNIDGLDGDGRLSGTIPVTFSDGTLIIENGRLATSAPGTIRFRSEKASRILADQGESLDLVLRALEDFRYDELTIDLEKSADDIGRMKLSLLGKNPAVLEGYPFRFNIGIEADTAKLVTALTTIYQVPNDFLRRAWTSGR